MQISNYRMGATVAFLGVLLLGCGGVGDTEVGADPASGLTEVGGHAAEAHASEQQVPAAEGSATAVDTAILGSSRAALSTDVDGCDVLVSGKDVTRICDGFTCKETWASVSGAPAHRLATDGCLGRLTTSSRCYPGDRRCGGEKEAQLCSDAGNWYTSELCTGTEPTRTECSDASRRASADCRASCGGRCPRGACTGLVAPCFAAIRPIVCLDSTATCGRSLTP